MEKPRILILCGGQFALPAIQQLAVTGYICGIAVGKGEKQITEALEEECTRAALPFCAFDDAVAAKGLGDWIDDVAPDAIFSICYPFRIPEALLDAYPDRFFNFHTGPLPGYRGPMPIFEVLRYNEPETALSIHFMDAEFDEGDLIFSETVAIESDDTFSSLAGKLSVRAAMAAQNMAEMLEYSSMIPRTPQDENAARYFEYPEKSDTYIQWNRTTAEDIERLVRACNPWNNGADAILAGMPVKLLSVSVGEGNNDAAPGTPIDLHDPTQLRVACAHNKHLNISIMSCEYGIVSGSFFAKKKGLTTPLYSAANPSNHIPVGNLQNTNT